ncbi:MAG: dihydroorotate dehydrogenase-like protein [Planctomycetota bacterium]|nr:MAG: dihydroorotate dehydrogenase-like protein [Planctomycetota bacterium]
MNVDMQSQYLGLQLGNPLVASASPLTGRLDMLKRLEDAGVAAAVLPSLFQEQIEHEELALQQLHEYHTDSFAESLDYFPELDNYNTGPDEYLDHIRRAKEMVAIPIIASLNGTDPGGWTRYATLLEQAGADALELNIYVVPTDPDQTGSEIEQRYIDIVTAVRHAVDIPIAVKVGPFFSSIPHMARQFVEAGAQGLVLFNRYLEPDIDLETLDVVPHLVLSTPAEALLARRWIGILYGRINASLAATSGIHRTEEVIKALLAGADVVMLASVLLTHGPEYLQTLLEELERWLSEREYASVRQMRGSVSQQNCASPEGYVRSNYMKALVSYTGKFI